MSLASWSTWWKSGRTIAADKLFSRRHEPRFGNQRRLQLDPLENRQMFAVSPIGTEFQVNSTANAGLVQQFAPDPFFFSADSVRSVAVDHDGDFVVAWTSYGQDGDGAGVYARVFSRTGAPLTDEFQVNQFTTGNQLNAAVAMDGDGDFVIAWESEGQDFNDASTGVYARRFRMPPSAGLIAAVGDPEFRVHTNMVDTQRNPAVAMNNLGQFVVTWQNESQDASFFNDIRSQVYDEDGNPVGGEFRVNQVNIPAEVDFNPDVAISPTGSFAISWNSNNSISYRVFEANGSPRNNESTANVSDASFVEQPFNQPNNSGHDPKLAKGNRPIGNSQISMDTAGNFIIVWQAFQDNDIVTSNDTPDSYGIYFRRFNADGTPGAARDSAANNVFTLDPNSNTDPDRFPGRNDAFSGDQVYPSVSIDADGDLAVVWRGYNQQGFGNEVQHIVFTPGTNIYGTFQLQDPSTGLATNNIAVADQVDASAIETALLGIGLEADVTDLGGGEFDIRFINGDANRNVAQLNIVNNMLFVGAPPPPPQPNVPPPPARPAATAAVTTTTDGPSGYSNAGIWFRRYIANAEFPVNGSVSTPGAITGQQLANTTNNNLQGHPSIAYEPDGDFVVVWDGDGGTDTDGIFAQRFNESTDAAGPLVTEALINGARVKTGDTIAQSSVNSIVVRFDEQLNNVSKTGTFSVENVNNWRLVRDGVEVTGGIANIEFDLNPQTNKWEAVVTVDSNGVQPGAPPLTNGNYQIVALNGIRDAVGNPLGSTGLVPNGGNFVRSFNVQLPAAGSEDLVNTTVANPQITHEQTRQAVAKDYDGDGVVVWTQSDGFDNDVFARRFRTNADGTTSFVGTAFQMNTIDPGDQRNASVAMDADGDFVVTWSSQSGNGDWDIFARRFDAVGNARVTNTALGISEFRVNTHTTPNRVDTHRYSSIAMDADGDFVITWQSYGQEGTAGGYGVYAQRYRNDGSRVGGTNEVQTITLTGDISSGGNFTVQIGAGAPQNVAIDPQNPTNTANNIKNALAPFVQVEVTANSPTQFAITFIGADAGKDAAPIVVADASTNFDVAIVSTTTGVSSEFRVNDTTARNQTEPVVSMDANGQFVIVWTSLGQGADQQFQSNVYGKLFPTFENISTALNEVQTLTFAPSASISGQFSIQIGNATSAPISVVGTPSATAIRNALTQLGFQTQVVDQGGGVFQITFLGTSASRNIPQITIVNNTVQTGGGAAVSITPDTTTEGFGAGEFLINSTFEANSQQLPHVAMDLDGDFVVTWTSYGQDNNGSGYGAGGTAEYGVFARRYSAGGFPDPTGFQVNNFSDGNQRYSSVALDADGDFTITWTSEGQDGSGYGIFGRSFQSLGTPLGSEFQVNATTLNNQQFSSIATDAQGQLTVVWSGNGTGDDIGVFLRQFVKATDDAGPIVADVLYTSNTPGVGRLPIRAGATIDQALTSVVVTLGEELDLDSARSASNWDILRGSTTIPDGIQNVTFAFNPVTNKWEATITFGEELRAGSYTIVARDTLFDTSLNFLDGNFDGFPGDDFLLNFTIVVGAQPQGPDDIVNESTANNQTTSADSPQSLAVDADGDYVVVWTFGVPGDSDVRGARFNAQGVRQGPDFVLSTTFAGNQLFAAVAKDADGDFVATWTTTLADGTTDVMARRFSNLGVPLGSEFVVNTLPGNQSRSSIAIDVNGDFVITWTVNNGIDNNIYARRFNSLGEAQGLEFQVNTTTAGNQNLSQVATDANGNFVVTWTSVGQDGSGAGVFARMFAASGAPLTGEFQVNTFVTGDQQYSRVARALNGNFVITWTSANQDGSQGGVYFQLYDATGAPIGGETRANVTTQGRQEFSAVAFDHLGNFTIAWSGNGANLQGNNDDRGIFARRFNSTGAPIAPPASITGTTDEFRVNTTTIGVQEIPYVGMSGSGDLVLAWTSTDLNGNPDVFRRQFDEIGDLAGPIVADVLSGPRQVRPGDTLPTTVTQLTVTFGEGMSVAGGPTAPNSVLNPSNWVLTVNGSVIAGGVSSVTPNTANGRFEAVLTLDGNGIGGGGAPALAEGNYTLTLLDEARDEFDNALDGDFNNLPGGNFTIDFVVAAAPATDSIVNANIAGSQTTSADSPQSVAADADGDYVVVWTDDSGGGNDIRAALFTAQGAQIGTEFLVNSSLAGSQDHAAVARDADGDFIVTWTTTLGDGSTDIMARRFDAVGNPLGVEFTVNTLTGNQSRSSIAMDVNGDFVISWTASDGNLNGVFARRFNSRGEGQGAEFLVNTTTAGNQQLSQVATDADGNFVVTWTGTDGAGTGVFVRLFDVNGAPLTAEIPVNTTLAGDQNYSRVARALDGSFVVTWTTANQDGNQTAVFFRLFDAAGNALGPETQANVSTQGSQGFSSVAIDHLGNFTIVWEGNGTNQGNIDDSGIFARRFDRNGTPLPPPAGISGSPDEFRVNTTLDGPQRSAHVTTSGAGDLVFVWTGTSLSPPNSNVYRRQFKNVTDLAGPIVADVLFGATQVRPNEALPTTVTQLTVTFGEQMSTAGGALGPNSVTNPSNWVLTLNGGVITGAISSVGFNINPNTGRYEALLTLDGNGIGGAGVPALPEGSYTLTLLDNVRDTLDNNLDGDFDTVPGGNFNIDFVVANAPVPEFLVNTTTANGQRVSPESQKAIGVDADGDFVVVWTSSGQDGSGDGVFAQRFSSTGLKLGGEILINNTTSGNQRNAAVAIDADGDFVVTWTSYGQGGDSSAEGNIYARRFTSAGTPRGNEFLVNQTTDFSQRWSSVAIDVDGDFVVTWTGNDANSYGVFAQQFNSLGARVGGEIAVNQTTAGSQRLSRVAVDGDGDFVIVWLTSDPVSPGATEIFARKFNADGTDLIDPITLLPVGEFQVAVGNNAFEEVSVAMDLDGDFVVAVGGRLTLNGSGAVGAQVFDAQGVVQTPVFVISPVTLEGRHPSVAMDHDGDFVVTWSGAGTDPGQEDSYGVYAQRYDLAGNPLPPPPSVIGATGAFRVNTTTAGTQQIPSVGVTGKGDFVIAWSGVGVGDADGVFARQFSIPGDDTGPIVADVLSGGNQIAPGSTVTGNITQLVVTFGEQMSTTGDIQNAAVASNYELLRDQVSIPGAVTGVTFSLNPATNKWQAVLSLDGDPSAPGIQPLPAGQYRIRVLGTLQDIAGNLLDGNYDGIADRPFERNFIVAGTTPPGVPGTPTGDEFVVNTNVALRQETSDIATDSAGNFVVVWSSLGQDGDTTTDSNIYLQRYNSSGAPIGAEFRVNRNPSGGLTDFELGSQLDPAIAMNDAGDFVVVWSGLSTGENSDRNGVFAQRFNSLGTPSGPAVLVNPRSDNVENQPSVAIDNAGNFVVTWTTNGSQDDIVAQRFDSLGQKIGGLLTVNSSSTGRQEQSRVAMDADGDFVVAWDSYGTDGSNWGVFAQRFTSGGSPVNGNVQVNQFNKNSQRDASVAMDPAGNVVITWSSFNQDGSGYGVYGRRYNAAGAPVSNEFQVNTFTASHQRFSDVDMDAAGNFVVTWTGFNQGGDNNTNGVFYRGFRADGTPVGAETRANRIVSGDQVSSEIAVSATGGFALAWTTPDTTSGTDIAARRFFSFTTAIAGPGGTASTIGLFAPGNSGFFLRNSNSTGIADNQFLFGPPGAGWQVLTGDWDGSGNDTPGLYNSATGTFYLKNTQAPGNADFTFQFGAAGAGWIAIAGDWNGDGIDTVGLYNRAGGAFFLRNSNDTGGADAMFAFGPAGTSDWAPLAGDWDGANGDSVGLYSPSNSGFFLRNTHSTGIADTQFLFGPPGAGWLPVIGDWDGDGIDSAGLYSQAGGAFFLKNAHAGGNADLMFAYGPAGTNWIPIAGAWNGTAGSPLMLDESAAFAGDSPASLTSADLQPVFDEAAARWALAGLDAGTAAKLRDLEVQITDLPGRYLGVTQGNKIYIDRDAAGREWFVDSTPGADEEFGTDGASLDPNIYYRVDLLTVVSHEIGHVLGLEDLDLLGHEADLMAESLVTGQRRLPSESVVDSVFAGSADW